MKLSLRLLALGAAFFSLGLSGLPAQPALPVSETVLVGGVVNQTPGQAWAYLFWQTDSLDLLNTRSYSIWQKTGDANSTSAFTRAGIVTLQSDPSAVGAIIERARLAFGEDPVELETTITGLFQNLMPTLTQVPAPQRLAAKVSAVLRGVTADPRQLQSLVLASRVHPSIAMAVGQAYSVKMPASGPVTFEVREYKPSTKTDVAVIGRVTLDVAAPLNLPVPTVLQQVPDSLESGYNHLNIKLVWDTPDALRRLAGMTQGFNLYRVKRAAALALGWQTTPPASAMLATMAKVPGSDVSRVNRAAITPKKQYSAFQVQTVVYGDQFIVDDASRLPGFPAANARPQRGDQYYYFVTSRDPLGHENNGLASPGLLATFCDRVMPDTPSAVKVTNEYGFNNGAPTQLLRVTWKANDNSGPKKTTGYLVYRWTTSDGPLQLTGNPPLPISRNPVANLVAGPIPHLGSPATFSYLDNGPGSPNVGSDLSRTVWYTIRAIDNGAYDAPPGGPFCNVSPFGGNVSANSAPAFGTLRNRVGPAAPTGVISILCPVPAIVAAGAPRFNDNTLDPNLRYVDLVATRPAGEENIEAVDFEQQSGATWLPLGRVHFAAGDTTLTKRWSFAPAAFTSPLVVRARCVVSNGDVSSFASNSLTVPPALSYYRASWNLTVSYVRVPLVTGGTTPRCIIHTPPSPGTGVNPPGGNGVLVEFVPPAGTRQYKLYYRIDDAPLTLAKEASQNFTAGQLLQVAGDILTAATSQVCLFLQVFDLDGNPSPLTPLGCLTLKGNAPLPKPMLAPIVSAGTAANPAALVQWFCPPVGVDKFEVWISSSPSALPASLGTSLNQDTTTPTGTSIEKTGVNQTSSFTYQVFHTEKLGPAFGSGSSFSVLVPVVTGQKLRVKIRAVSESLQHGAFSNVESHAWALPPAFVGPEVPWPARPLPGLADASKFTGALTAAFFPAEGFVGITLGISKGNSRTFTPAGQSRLVTQLQSTDSVESNFFTAAFQNPDADRTPLPCILYRTQVPDVASPPSKPLANYPTVPGDMVQVSPLMESISAVVEAYPGGGSGTTIYDPFLHVVSFESGSGTVNAFYLKDTTPVLSGARYFYLLVLLDPVTHEISRVLPLHPIDIP